MNENQLFLEFLSFSKQTIFIEAEAKKKRMEKFIYDYNETYNQSVSLNDDGICILNDEVDKWGLELRIYFNDKTQLPDFWIRKMYRNTVYHSEQYSYRIDNSKLITFLFEEGYKLGGN